MNHAELSDPTLSISRATKQGNRLLRFLWGEAALTASRRDVALKRFYRRKLHQKGV